MKPKNRVMCPDCGREKMLFESASAANKFIEFNKDEDAFRNKKLRVYYCPACCGYHISSKSYRKFYGKQTENMINAYKRATSSSIEKKEDALEKRMKIWQSETDEVKRLYTEYMADTTYGSINDFLLHNSSILDEFSRKRVAIRIGNLIANIGRIKYESMTKSERKERGIALAIKAQEFGAKTKKEYMDFWRKHCKGEDNGIASYYGMAIADMI